MMFVTAREMRDTEEALFADGVCAEDLMNLAGLKIAREIMARFPAPESRIAVAVVGKGNNGADALVALRHLGEAGWPIAVRSSSDPSTFTGLPARKWRELEKANLVKSLNDLPENRGVILLDGLLGIGTEGTIREPLATLAREMNELRACGRALIFAVDVPSGIDCDIGRCGNDTVIADVTCTLGMPKQGLVADGAASHVGSLVLLSLPGLSRFETDDDHLICPETLPVRALQRPFDFHKGQAGRVGIVAGSRGLAGAAALCSLGALRGGAGLITLFVKDQDYALILPLIPVEVMVKPVTDYRDVLRDNIDALAIGPGLGNCGNEVLSLISRFQKPTVIDADALNLIARRSHLSTLRRNQVVTPHPGEFTRLLPNFEAPRKDLAREFTKRSAATLLFKGSRSIVTQSSAPLSYNTTGTPGMATGGQGDVLTGVIAALLARGLTGIESAKTGAWLTGKAAELGLQSESIESLSATTTSSILGAAFQALREGSSPSLFVDKK